MKLPTHISGILSLHFHKTSLLLPFQNSHSFSSSPLSDEPLVSAAVSILKHHRSKSRWSNLRSLIATSPLTPHQFSEIALQIRNNPHLTLHLFNFTLNHSLSSHSILSYATVIHILARARLKTRAQNVIKSAMHVFHSSTPISILEALVKTYRSCDSAPFVFDLLVRACLESKKIDQAIEIYRMLASKNVLLNSSTCDSLIELVSKSRGCFAGYDLFREIVGKSGAVSADTFNVVMVGFYREKLLDKVEELWEEMERIGCVPNTYTYNVLMASYCDVGRMDDAMKLFDRIENEGLKCDVIAYNTIIGGFCLAGNLEKAVEFYRVMTMNGFDATRVTFEHMIIGYCKIGVVGSAVVLCKDMRRKGFSLENWTVNLVVRTLCDKNEVCAAVEFLRLEIKKREVFLEEESYQVLVRALCLAGKMDDALKIQSEMVGKGFESGVEMYGAFIDGYMKQGDEVMACKLRNEMATI